MRLTDLVRDRNSEKGGRSSRSAGQSDVQPMMPVSETKPKKSGQVTGHLQAGDLSALYDVTSSPAKPSPPAEAEYSDAGTVESQPAAVPEDYPIEPQPVAESPDTESPDTESAAPEMPPAPAAQPVKPPARAADSGSDYYENMEEFELADALHIELLTHLDDVYAEGKDDTDIYIERLIRPLSRAIDLSKTSNALLRKAVRMKKGARSFTTHSLNVAIIAVKIGLAREYSDERVFSLALCALLGDIGMTRVDPAILNKAGKLTPEEFMEIKRHIEYSVEIVNSVSNKFPFLGPIIYQIHERENGSGYPQAIKGANIHEFAKIIGMCDVYIALTEPKANREHYSGYVAMQQIISRRGIDFDSKIIKTLIDVISVFPLESLVRLNNAAIGRVIDISPVHPTRPKLSILINSDGEKLKRPQLLDLEKEPLLYIENPDIEEGVIL